LQVALEKEEEVEEERESLRNWWNANGRSKIAQSRLS
jgi:hypothetical protein